MKFFLPFLLAITSAFSVFCQNVPVDFESSGFGAAWTWTVFENSTNPALQIVPNPDTSGLNTSCTVAQFTALQAGNPWAGCETSHGAGIGSWTVDTSNYIVKILVWKSVISDVGIKLVRNDNWSLGEIKIPNTLTNQWEVITFDFSAHIGNTYDQIVVFPDFQARTSDNIVYFDHIYGDPATAVGCGSTCISVNAPPVPDSTTLSDVVETNCQVTSLVAPTATDSCGNTVIGTHNASLPITALGTTTITWTYTDNGGNTATQMQDVVISCCMSANTPPVPDSATLNDIVTINCQVTSLVAPTATDSCGNTIMGTHNASLPITTIGTTTVTWTYTDNGGNTATQTQDVVISCTVAPYVPVDFESTGFGAAWTWTVFENDSNPALQMVTNPDMTGMNTSCTVAKFTALQTGNPWAGCETSHGAGIGSWTIDTSNHIIKILVWKSVISDVGIKLVRNDNWSLGEIKIPNTLTNQWEEITFDFSAHIGNTYDQIVVFPDFQPRTSDNIVYFDHIYGDASSVVNCATGIEEIEVPVVSVYPNPSQDLITFSMSNVFTGQIVINDIVGRTLMTENFNSDKTVLSLNKLPAKGIYFATILNEQGNVLGVKKIIYQ